MRTMTTLQRTMFDPTFPLLESGDLPGNDDWSVLETLRSDGAGDYEDDCFASVTVATSFDD